MSTPYADLDEADQIEVVRRVAVDAADAFGLEVTRLEPLLHAYNTTFEVRTADGTRLAMRVGTNSPSTPAHLISQQEWVHAIRTQTDVLVPEAIAAPDGRFVLEVACPEMGRDLLVVLNSWLEGPDIGVPDAGQARALGRVTATLHEHAAGWPGASGLALPTYADPLFGDRDVLTEAAAEVPGGSEVVGEALQRCRDAFATLADEPHLPLHADLHGSNLKWHRGRLAVFDFDDCGYGPAVLDLAIATFYLRVRPESDAEATSAALLEGYAERRPLPAGTGEHLDALMAARQLLLANDLLGTSTASLRAGARDYLTTTVERLSAWLGTGRFGAT